MSARKSPVDYLIEDRGYDTPCWAWQLSKGNLGYGLTRRGTPGGKRNQAAHRFYYKEHVGPIPEGMDLHHLCGQRDCVNPTHLKPLTTGAHLRQHSQLTPEMVAEIRSRYVPRKVTRAMLADEFGTSTRNIKHIIAGTTWQEVQTA